MSSDDRTGAVAAAAEPRVAVVVLNWNGGSDTLECLASLEHLTYRNCGVVVVDNGSTDDSVAAIRARFPRIELIETGKNLGFAGGNNVGMRHALKVGAEYVLLLNNDTEVDPGLIEAFVAAALARPDAGVFSGKIYFHAEPRRIWYAGAAWSAEAARFEQVGEGALDDDGRYSVLSETAFACGCAFFVSAVRLREIGLLDEDFFLYFEETDWCFRARAAGHPSIYVPQARLWHKVSAAFGGEGSPLALYFLTRNKLLWARRHGTAAQRADVRRVVRLGLSRRLRFAAPASQPGGAPHTLQSRWWSLRAAFSDPHTRAFLLGLRDYVLRRFGDCPPVVRELSAAVRARRQSAAGTPAASQATGR